MPEDSAVPAALRSFIGETIRHTEPFPIDAGMIRRFAEVIGDDDPLYFDETYAQSTPSGGIVAPPTLLFEWNHHSHGGMPREAAHVLSQELGYRPATVRGINEYDVIQPLRPGDVIASEAALEDVYIKEGRTGTLTFFVVGISYTNQHGDLLGRTRDTYIAPTRPRQGTTRGGGVPGLAPAGELPERVIELNVEQFARYAAVCWDFAAAHYDAATASAQGYHAAYADAPMVTAMLASQAKQWAGAGAVVERIDATYRGMMFPGDVLTLAGRPKATEEDANGFHFYEVWARNQDGRAVVRGSVTARVPTS